MGKLPVFDADPFDSEIFDCHHRDFGPTQRSNINDARARKSRGTNRTGRTR